MGQLDVSVPDRFRAGLAILLTAFDYAQDSQTDAWQFAVELPELFSTGATLADIRWLVLRGFAEHGKETTLPGDDKRTFRRLASTSFPTDACLVLVPAGATAVRAFLSQRALNSTDWHNAISLPSQGLASSTDSQTEEVSRLSQSGPAAREVQAGQSVVSLRQPVKGTSPIPHYDPMLHELRLGDEIIKRFTRPAAAQEFILAAFQEEGWPPAIDDPLPGQLHQDPKRRLHYTIRNLNRGQHPLRIRFFINGNGETIRWQIVAIQRAISARKARKQR
jgi:hypothetical protein